MNMTSVTFRFWAEKPASSPHRYEFSPPAEVFRQLLKFKYIDFFFDTELLHYGKTYFNNTLEMENID